MESDPDALGRKQTHTYTQMHTYTNTCITTYIYTYTSTWVYKYISLSHSIYLSIYPSFFLSIFIYTHRRINKDPDTDIDEYIYIGIVSCAHHLHIHIDQVCVHIRVCYLVLDPGSKSHPGHGLRSQVQQGKAARQLAVLAKSRLLALVVH